MQKRKSSSRGSSLIEFALCLPFLTILVLGTIDGARLFSTWNRAKNAAQQGANYAQLYPTHHVTGATCADPNNILDRVQNEGSDLTVQIYYSGVVQTPSCSELSSSSAIQPGDTVSVKVTAPFSFITPFAKALWGDPTVTATAKITVQG